MLSVIIVTDGREPPVVATLAALIPAATGGLVRGVVLVDAGETDVIARVADVAGCDFVACPGPRAAALAAGVRQARSPWLMFLPTGAVPDANWIDEVTQFILRTGSAAPRAAIFRRARSPYDDDTLRARLSFALRRLSGPQPDQGLVIERRHFERLGGYPADQPDAERRLLRRLGRARHLLRSAITVST